MEQFLCSKPSEAPATLPKRSRYRVLVSILICIETVLLVLLLWLVWEENWGAHARYVKVKEGMTEKEVVTILGRPDGGRNPIAAEGRIVLSEMFWDFGKDTAVVYLDHEGKVTHKS
jgi:hypothetical protein